MYSLLKEVANMVKKYSRSYRTITTSIKTTDLVITFDDDSIGRIKLPFGRNNLFWYRNLCCIITTNNILIYKVSEGTMERMCKIDGVFFLRKITDKLHCVTSDGKYVYLDLKSIRYGRSTFELEPDTNDVEFVRHNSNIHMMKNSITTTLPLKLVISFCLKGDNIVYFGNFMRLTRYNYVTRKEIFSVELFHTVTALEISRDVIVTQGDRETYLYSFKNGKLLYTAAGKIVVI